MATIKELAEQAGFDSASQTVWAFDNFDLERFAELIRQDERDKCAQDYLKDCNNTIEAAFNECKKEIEHNHKVLNIMIDTARKDEREACAKLCEKLDVDYATAGRCAFEIRQRGEQP